MRRPRDLVFRVGLAAGALLLAAAGVVAWTDRSQPADQLHRGTIPSAVAEPNRTTEPTQIEASTTPQRSARRDFSPGQRRPLSLRIPSLQINAPIDPVTVDTKGQLGVPSDPHRLGWWSDGPAPGAPKGTAVIDGHVDWAGSGPGALFHLSKVRIGATVIVEEVLGPVEFRIAALREYHKKQLPWKQIFSQHVKGRLVIVTCGGEFNERARSYTSNIVAYAVPVTG